MSVGVALSVDWRGRGGTSEHRRSQGRRPGRVMLAEGKPGDGAKQGERFEGEH